MVFEAISTNFDELVLDTMFVHEYGVCSQSPQQNYACVCMNEEHAPSSTRQHVHVFLCVQKKSAP